jgi:hypothetical protein
MKTKTPRPIAPPWQPTEEEIRDYAYHLFVQEGCAHGHDLEHWLEAEACLRASIPREHARTRLHRHTLSAPAPGLRTAAA